MKKRKIMGYPPIPLRKVQRKYYMLVADVVELAGEEHLICVYRKEGRKQEWIIRAAYTRNNWGLWNPKNGDDGWSRRSIQDNTYEIVAGTTPTLVYNFSKVRPSDITSAVLTAKKRGTVVLEKDLTSATITEETVSWTLTQEETLQLETSAVEFMLNWVDNNGTRGVGKVIDARVVPNHISEVLV